MLSCSLAHRILTLRTTPSPPQSGGNSFVVAVVALRQLRCVQRRNDGADLLGVKALRRRTRRYSSQRDEFHHLTTDTHVDGQMR